MPSERCGKKLSGAARTSFMKKCEGGRRNGRQIHLTVASLQPFYPINVSERTRVGTDRFRAMVCKGMPFYRATPSPISKH